VGIQDRHGNRVTVTRPDANRGRVLRLTSPSGRWVEFTYGLPGNTYMVTQIQDNLGRTVSYTYDASNRLIAVTDAGGGVMEYTYDAFDRMLTVKDARGIVYLTNEYDSPGPGGRISRQTHADGTT
jgi:YD repeat-containing protein